MRRALAAAAMAAMLPLPVAAAPRGGVIAAVLPPAPFEEVLSSIVSGVVVRAGGAGLLSAPGDEEPVAAARERLAEVGIDLPSVADPSEVGRQLRAATGEVLVVLIIPTPGRMGEDTATLALARGEAEEIVQVRRDPGGLRSSTTRRAGLVSTVDLAPTVRAYLGEAEPPGSRGAAIEVSGRAPSALVARYRTLQPLRVPMGVGMLGLALLGLLVGLGILWRGSAPGASVVGVVGLFAAALPISLLVAVMAGRPTVTSVIVVTAAGAAAIATAAWWLGRPVPAASVAIVAGAGLLVVMVDGMLGWRGMFFPLLGGNAFEGSRFYGMAQGYGGVFVAGAILVGSRLRPWAGVALLIAAGILAGLPGFGADFGTALTLFAAAPLWILLRRRALWPLLGGLGAAAAGVATVLIANRRSPDPTHVTSVLEGAERSGIAALVDVYLHRLALNVEGLMRAPVAWLVLAAIPVWTVVAWRRLGPFGEALRRDPAWRDAAVVLGIASVLGFLLNDTIGVAGMGLVYLSVALVYPALAMRWTSS